MKKIDDINSNGNNYNKIQTQRKIKIDALFSMLDQKFEV